MGFLAVATWQFIYSYSRSPSSPGEAPCTLVFRPSTRCSSPGLYSLAFQFPLPLPLLFLYSVPFLTTLFSLISRPPLLISPFTSPSPGHSRLRSSFYLPLSFALPPLLPFPSPPKQSIPVTSPVDRFRLLISPPFTLSFHTSMSPFSITKISLPTPSSCLNSLPLPTSPSLPISVPASTPIFPSQFQY